MFQVPVTFLFDYEYVAESMRPYVFDCFAAAGAKHMVLTDTLIGMIMQKSSLAETLLKEAADAGLSFVDAHAPFGKELDTNVMDCECRKRAVWRQKIAISTAAQMKIDTITVHVGNSRCFPDVPVAEQRKYSIDFLEQILPTAEEYGITVCIENIWFPNNTTSELNAILKAIHSPHLGLCYDAGHANLMRSASAVFAESSALLGWRASGYDSVEWNDHILEDMLPNVVSCHLHDNNGQYDQHRNIGHGNVDWKYAIPLLKQAPRLKNVQSEVIPCKAQEPIAEICSAFQKLSEL